MKAAIILFTVLYGYLAHQTRRFVYQRFGTGWRELVSYTVGVFFVFPIFAVLVWVLSDHDEDSVQRAGLAYFLAYAPFGIGTFLGWLADGGNGSEI